MAFSAKVDAGILVFKEANRRRTSESRARRVLIANLKCNHSYIALPPREILDVETPDFSLSHASLEIEVSTGFTAVNSVGESQITVSMGTYSRFWSVATAAYTTLPL
jgi:hypothetical protein